MEFWLDHPALKKKKGVLWTKGWRLNIGSRHLYFTVRKRDYVGGGRGRDLEQERKDQCQ